MRVMKGLEKRGGIWRVRVAIPVDLRAQWGKREEIISLQTGDETVGIERGAPLIADIKRRIKALRNPATAAPTSKPAPVARLRPEDAFQIIQAWRHAEIDRAYADAFDPEGEVEPCDVEAASRLRYALSHHSTVDQVEGFDDRLAAILNRSADSAVVRQPTVREWFRDAWSDVEGYLDRFARSDFNGWPEAGEPVQPAQVAPVATKAGMSLSALRDAWDAVKPLNPRQKGYIRRLIEHLGDRDIATITPTDMDGFLIELRRFPLTKKPEDDKLAFRDLIARYDGTDKARLHVKTIWNWTVTYKGLFAFAVSRRLIDFNPAADMMRKPSAEDANDRKPYADADLDVIFTRPMFTGFEGRADIGYRDQPGSQVVKDSKYWLPIVALHTGMRLEELASLRKTEVIDTDEGLRTSAEPVHRHLACDGRLVSLKRSASSAIMGSHP